MNERDFNSMLVGASIALEELTRAVRLNIELNGLDTRVSKRSIKEYEKYMVYALLCIINMAQFGGGKDEATMSRLQDLYDDTKEVLDEKGMTTC